MCIESTRTRLFTVLGLSMAIGAISRTAAASTESSTTTPFTLGGYVEAAYSLNFNAPSNGITHFRGFDNRHNTFTLSNVALDARWDAHDLIGRLTLQVGHTPSTYYLAEPGFPGAAATSASDAGLWKYIQQAYVGYRFEEAKGLTVTAGLFLSPIGPEGVAVRDNWNWSRSNLFFGLPFYHTGLRVALPLGSAWEVSLAGFNGWNTVVDNNDEKSIALQLTHTQPGKLALSFLYFTGVERAEGAAEGRGWRHLLDAHATWTVNERLSLLLHASGGLEPTNFGTSGWVAGALYGRVQLLSWLFVAVRGDVFFEEVASNGAGAASSIFWPVAWVSSGTATLDARPHDQISFRLEYRHDHAAGDMYFGGQVVGDGTTTAFVPNERSQDTITLGATAWF